MKSIAIILLAISLIGVSCKNSTEQTANTESTYIEITKAQFESEKMMIGTPTLSSFAEVVYFTGTIIPDINGQAKISLPLAGIITKINYKPNQIINKGSILFEISGNELVDLQKDFAESWAILGRLKSDYNRSKELYTDSVVTQKDFVMTESSYYAEKAKYNALKIKLESLGLDVSKIEKGEFYSSYYIKSPINGFIASMDVVLSQYIEPQQSIAEIMDAQSYQLSLSVFEKNIHQIKTGQSVIFYLNGDKTEKQEAKINSVGKNILNESKTITCYATLEAFDIDKLVGNQFVEGEIYTVVDSAMAVPETAIITSENTAYVLMLEKEDDSMYYFKKSMVPAGRKNNQFYELPSQFSTTKLLVNGVYNLQIE